MDNKVYTDNLNSLFDNNEKAVKHALAENTPRPEVVKMLQKHVKKSHALPVEQGIYNYTLEHCKSLDIKCHWSKGPFMHLYAFEVKNRIKNLKDNSSLRAGIKKKKDAYEFVLKEKADLRPDLWEGIKQKRKSMNDAHSFKEGTDAYKCKRCGERKSEVMLAQTRSADEPMTTFITCLYCGYKLKFC